MTTRRQFISKVGQASALSVLPLGASAGSISPPPASAIIDAVEIVRVTGVRTSIDGISHQYQSQPIHIYPDQRPPIYKDQATGTPRTGNLTHDYLRIRTRGGIDGLYGPVDSEAVPPILQQLRPFLIGKDAMQGETLWDKLYRNNRHSRGGHYMMALSMVDNALWDIRGKALGVPVYQLLGGPTRKEVRVYGSCLGFSVEKGKAGAKAKQLYGQGFLHQKWFMAYSPVDGNAGSFEASKWLKSFVTR